MGIFQADRIALFASNEELAVFLAVAPDFSGGDVFVGSTFEVLAGLGSDLLVVAESGGAVVPADDGLDVALSVVDQGGEVIIVGLDGLVTVRLFGGVFESLAGLWRDDGDALSVSHGYEFFCILVDWAFSVSLAHHAPFSGYFGLVSRIGRFAQWEVGLVVVFPRSPLVSPR